MREGLDDEDRVKLDTWYYVMNLLEHYRAVTFDPMYQRGSKFLASARDRENLASKLEIIRKNHLKLHKRWEDELGPKWRHALEQD
jgi:hypothetical protein